LCKRRRRPANAFFDKLVLGCICCLGLGLFASSGSKWVEMGRKGYFFFFQYQLREKTIFEV